MRDSNIPHTSFDSRGRNAAPWERLGLVAMAVLTAFFLATSWRRWLDPLIDFGRELYLPWRISNGAMLYRDVDDFYGPLSQYLNACLFRVFGPGLMVLVAANLAVYAAVIGLIYMLFRRAWGVGAALASCAVFVSVFSFSQFYGGNHNFAAPYAHEATHGFLVCLLLVLTLSWWLDVPSAARAALAGLLLGLTVVLKPEIMLAAALVTGAAAPHGVPAGKAATRLLDRRLGRGRAASDARLLGLFLSECSVRGRPFYSQAGLGSTWWRRPVSRATLSRSRFLGLDRPWPHLLEHGSATLIAILLLAAIVASAKAADRTMPVAASHPRPGTARSGTFLLSWVGSAGSVLAAACSALRSSTSPAPWSPLSGVRRRARMSRARASLDIAALAAGLMARMVLNGRIYQFGFYQAALAGILVPAVMIGEVPERFSLGRRGRATLVTLSILLMGTGVVRLVIRSQSLFDLKTYAVGKGIDRFYSIPPQIDASGALVNFASDELGKAPRNQTLLVIPEGEMINYLARLPSPVAPFFFFSAATQDGREQAIVADLSRRPPNWVVLVSRDLREYGVARYGESPDQGGQILGWVAANYRPVASIGDDPLDVHKRGAVILAPKQ